MTERKAIPHLMSEPPISVYPSLAKALGNVNKAIILQQLHFLLNVAKQAKNEYVHIDDKWWVYNSYEQWQEYFPWLSTSTIKGLFGMLEHDGFVISRQGVKSGFDRRKWYTIDYNAYLTYIQSIGQKMSDVRTKNVSSESQKMSDDISENTSETTTEITPLPPKKGDSKKALSSEVLEEKRQTDLTIAAYIRGLNIAPAANQYGHKTNRTAAAAILNAGYTPEQVTEYTQHVQKQDYWRGKKPPLNLIAEGIAAYFASKPKPAEPLPVPEFHYDPALDDGTPASPERIAQARELFAQLVQRTNANGR